MSLPVRPRPRNDSRKAAPHEYLQEDRAQGPSSQRRRQEDRLRLTGSRRLRAKGRADQAKGNLKQAGAKVKDALKH